jgi:hypothetical protein
MINKKNPITGALFTAPAISKNILSLVVSSIGSGISLKVN